MCLGEETDHRGQKKPCTSKATYRYQCLTETFTSAHLHKLTQTPITPSLPSSPSSSSALSPTSTSSMVQPTAQAIATAHLALVLLASAGHRTPLKETKATLTRVGGVE